MSGKSASKASIKCTSIIKMSFRDQPVNIEPTFN